MLPTKQKRKKLKTGRRLSLNVKTSYEETSFVFCKQPSDSFMMSFVPCIFSLILILLNLFFFNQKHIKHNYNYVQVFFVCGVFYTRLYVNMVASQERNKKRKSNNFGFCLVIKSVFLLQSKRKKFNGLANGRAKEGHKMCYDVEKRKKAKIKCFVKKVSFVPVKFLKI